MRRPLILLSFLLTVCSCNMVDRVFHSRQDQKVAAVGKEILYRSDLEKVVPSGATPQDSARMAEQYINSWVLDRILLSEAVSYLSKEEKSEAESKVAEFRQNLLTFKYEQRQVAESLDTVVSREAAEQYYSDHKEAFVSSSSVIKGRVIRISEKSPYYAMIRDRFRTTDAADLSEFEQTCRSYAESYSDFGGNWVPVSALARELGMDVSKCEADLARSTAYEEDIDGNHFLVFIQGRTAPGEVTPLDYNIDSIKEVIISRRKQDFLTSLEQELFDNALARGKIKIYGTQDD